MTRVDNSFKYDAQLCFQVFGEQRRFIFAIARKRGEKPATIEREAVREYLENHKNELTEAELNELAPEFKGA